MRLKKFTVDQFMAFRPCLSQEQVTLLFAGRDTLTARDALSLKIQPDQIIWSVTRPGVLPKDILRRWLADVVERCLMRERKAGREPDARSWAVVPALRRYPGKKRMAEISATTAAYAAAYATTATTAYAAYAAAAYAAYAAADAAGAEYQWQIARLREILLDKGSRAPRGMAGNPFPEEAS